MVVVPLEADGVLAHAFGGDGLSGRLEHRQRAGGKFGGFAGLSFGLVPFFAAHSAGAGVA